MTLNLAIGIATCKRPDELRTVLESLSRQDIADNTRFTVRIVVADNAPMQDNQDVIKTIQPSCPFPITYIEEPEPGIPFVRNAIVKNAWNDDALIFIDDDEIAHPSWARRLIETWQDTGADIVTGPVPRIIPSDAPKWAVKGDIFRSKQYQYGESIGKAYTNNLLISRQVFHTIKPVFDPRFRHTGSSDLHFSLKAKAGGYTIVWCPDAVAEEIVPDSRISLSWLTKRSFRSGSGDTISRMMIKPGITTFANVVFLSAARLATGCLYGLLGMATINWRYTMLGFRRIVSGLGSLSGLFGLNYNEYKSMHDR